MKCEYKKLKDDVLYERSQVEVVISDIQKLVGGSARDDMSRDQKTAIAGYLMNFYNGIENIMKRVAKDYYRKFCGTNNCLSSHCIHRMERKPSLVKRLLTGYVIIWGLDTFLYMVMGSC